MTTLLPSERIREASLPLAREENPQTVAAQQREIAKLERRLFIVESLLRRVSEWDRAVIRWMEDEREDLVMDVELDDDRGMRRGLHPVTLHSLVENDKLEAYASCVQRIMNGELPRYLCDSCRDAECPTRIVCRDAARDWRTAETIFTTRVPEYVHSALEKLLAARGEQA